MKALRVIIYGCGVMGRKVAEALLGKKSFTLVGAVDRDESLVGQDVGSLLDHPASLGIHVEKTPDRIFSAADADVVVLTTTSRLPGVFPQIKACVEAGMHVVSTCEELSYPWRRHPDLAREIDALAKKDRVTVVGTGINPGFLMDTLPLVLTAPCLGVRSIQVTRMMDSSKRRIPFQKKIGTGLTPSEFRERIDAGIITGHVGLLESLYMIADGLEWKLEEAREIPPEPVLAETEVKTGLGKVLPGNVIGLQSVAYGMKAGEKAIQLLFNANAGVEEEYDEVVIQGHPGIRQRIIGGVHGDTGTVAVTVNTIPRAAASDPGLKVMKDLPPPVAVP